MVLGLMALLQPYYDFMNFSLNYICFLVVYEIMLLALSYVYFLALQAMWMMMQLDEPDDFVISTGETTSVRDFIELAFAEVGMEIV